ncbi:MAG: hypothetical protein S4CHLAM20_15530 [Chlamydiia bacterium]|nr:hypothetical protein [Chlamydiia bacterium]
MWRIIFIILLFSKISSEDQSVTVDGTVDTSRFVMLSENTLSALGDDVLDTGSGEHLIGSIEIITFNNVDTGTVYIQNLEYKDDLFMSVGELDTDNQILLRVKSNREEDGSIASPYRTITPADPAVIRDPDTTGTPLNEKTILEFYALDSTSNVLASVAYEAHFTLVWGD